MEEIPELRSDEPTESLAPEPAEPAALNNSDTPENTPEKSDPPPKPFIPKIEGDLTLEKLYEQPEKFRTYLAWMIEYHIVNDIFIEGHGGRPIADIVDGTEGPSAKKFFEYMTTHHNKSQIEIQLPRVKDPERATELKAKSQELRQKISHSKLPTAEKHLARILVAWHEHLSIKANQ